MWPVTPIGAGKAKDPARQQPRAQQAYLMSALIGQWDRLVRAIPVNQRAFWDSPLDYCSFAYSALACLRMGMSASASFQRVKKSL